MHLQLNLSNQLAKQWKTPLSDTPPETHPLLRWRLDKMKLGRTTANYVCVNEESLFSFVLAGAAGKKDMDIQQLFVSRVLNLLEYYLFPDVALELFDELAVMLGKTESRKVIGAVTEIRHQYNAQYEYCQVEQIVAEHRVNSAPMCGPDYFYPFEKFLAFRNLFEDRGRQQLSFTLPQELRRCAHRNLHESFTFPLYCFSNEAETARVPIGDLMLLHQGVLETLELKQAKPEDVFQLNRLANLLLETIEGFLSGSHGINKTIR
jgi:hypothetical protein